VKTAILGFAAALTVLAAAVPAHVDVDADFGNQLHTYGI
jgi:hypothetical protein